MSIHISITVENVGELHNALRQLLIGTAPAAVSVGTDAPKPPKAKSLTEAEKERAIKAAESQKEDDAARQKLQDERNAQAAAAKQEAPGEPASAAVNTSPPSSVTGETTTAPGQTGGATAAPAASSPAASTADPGVPDYDTVVAPAIIALAEAKGRGPVLAILEQFGTQNAREVPPERRAELVALVNEARGA